jgi:HSP20 family protein
MYRNAFTHANVWNPWQDMQRLQAEISRLVHGLGGLERASEPEFPPIEAWAGEHGLRICASMPGVDMKDVEVSVVGDTLTIKGTRSAETSEAATFHRRERASGKFVRTLQLPFSIEVDAVKAASRNGMLEIDLPRAIADRPRKIAVQAN